MPRIRQRIAYELTSSELLLTPDTQLDKSVPLGEKGHCCGTGKVFPKPKVPPVDILVLDDSKISSVTKPEVQPIEDL